MPARSAGGAAAPDTLCPVDSWSLIRSDFTHEMPTLAYLFTEDRRRLLLTTLVALAATLLFTAPVVVNTVDSASISDDLDRPSEPCGALDAGVLAAAVAAIAGEAIQGTSLVWASM